jgi:serine/threonine protein kinase
MSFCIKCGYKLDSDVVFCPECGTPVRETKKSQKEQDDIQDTYKTQVRGKPQTYGVLNLENLPVGHIIDNRYEIKEKIGQGGFGAVYRVYDKKMNIDKALKIIPEAMVSDEEAMADLQAEARTMISLNHNNIVRVYDFHDTGAIKYIDMEYVEGKTLTKLKLEHPNKQIPEAKVKELAIKIADGLSYAHSNNILHKDIKPQNVMVTEKDEIKIMDFGIAETVRTSMSRIDKSISSGTLVYMSPEQIKGQNIGKESDIYSFGAMLYEVLSGHPPFYKGAVEYQILNEKPKKMGNVSKEMNCIILKCLQKDYKNRYTNIDKIIQELDSTPKRYKIVEGKPYPKRPTGSLKKLVPISIITEPSDAIVYLDGKRQKQLTPLNTKNIVGEITIKIEKEEYKTIEDKIEISGSSTNEFYLELESVMGSLTVESEKVGQTIWMNEKRTEFKSPYTFENIIPNKEYTFQINQSNYLSEKKKVKINNFEDKKILLSSSILGSITIETNEPGHTIWMNGKKTEFLTPYTFKNIIPNKEYRFAIETETTFSEDYSVKIKEKENKVVKIIKFREVPEVPANLIFVKGGTFQMGQPDPNTNGTRWLGDEQLVHEVFVDRFFIGKYPVTQKEYEEIMRNNPSYFKEEKVIKTGFLKIASKVERLTVPEKPVERVSWYDAVEFCNKKSIKEGLTPCYSGSSKNIECDFTANGYRLPTEAEWEYAARGGNKSRSYKYSGSDNIEDVAWYYGNSGDITHPVGTKQPNELGIYDMSGNVWEWCNDWYDANYYEKSSKNNPKGPDRSIYHVLRGGCFPDSDFCCLAVGRNYDGPTSSDIGYGFRLVRTP